jgi:hypothetical protein
MAQVIDRKEVHDLIDRMSVEQLPAAASLLKSMLADPEDDEPVTEEDIRRLHEVRAALERGEKGTPMEEFLAEFGLKMEDLPSK